MTTEAMSGDQMEIEDCLLSAAILRPYNNETHIVSPAHPEKSDGYQWRTEHGEDDPSLLIELTARAIITIPGELVLRDPVHPGNSHNRC